MLPAKLIMETEQNIAKIEALANESRPVDYLLSCRLHEIAQSKRIIIEHAKDGRPLNLFKQGQDI